MSYFIASISNGGGAPEQAFRKMQSAGACTEKPFAGEGMSCATGQPIDPLREIIAVLSECARGVRVVSKHAMDIAYKFSHWNPLSWETSP